MAAATAVPVQEIIDLLNANTAMGVKLLALKKAGNLSLASLMGLASDTDIQTAIKTDVADAKDLAGILATVEDISTWLALMPTLAANLRALYLAWTAPGPVAAPAAPKAP
jgi:hypothetical protein